MWWLIPAAGVALKLIYDVISLEEQEARERWENKREEAENTLAVNELNIKNHIFNTQNIYNYSKLVQLHYSSVKAANYAYKLLGDARSSIRTMNKMLKKAKERRTNLQKKLAKAKQNKDRKKIFEIIEELKMVNELRRNLFEDRDKVRTQESNLLTKVRRLNSETRELKKSIRDKCGVRGRRWYERLEERKNSKSFKNIHTTKLNFKSTSHIRF